MRITADSVIDDQLDEVYTGIQRLMSRHEADGAYCGECGFTAPCRTLRELRRIDEAFVRRVPTEEMQDAR